MEGMTGGGIMLNPQEMLEYDLLDVKASGWKDKDNSILILSGGGWGEKVGAELQDTYKAKMRIHPI